MHSKLQIAAAEVFGTAALVFIGAGSVVATVHLELGDKVNFGGAELLGIAFAFFFVITAMVYAIGRVSGCHINPAVTFGLALTKRCPWSDVPLYWISQVVGGVIGALGIYALFAGDPVASAAMSPALLGTGHVVGSNAVAVANLGVGFGAEFLGTGLLMFTILGIVDDKAPGMLAGLVIGGVVLAIIMLIGPLTSASLNPARAFAPAIIDQLFVAGGPRTAWGPFVLVYVVAGLAGSGLAALFYDFLNKETATQPAASSAS